MSKEFVKIDVTRRDVLAGGTAALLGLAGVLSASGAAKADAAATQALIDKITGGTAPQSGRVMLEMPQIAENGNTVPMSLSVESPMTDADYVKTVHVFAEGNPTPDVASFHFTPMSGNASISTRMRMAKTQDIVAVAEMSDGSIFMDRVQVKVTIGGCGG